MFQDINPHIYNVEYKDKKPKDNDYILFFKNNCALISEKEEVFSFPDYKEIKEVYGEKDRKYIYLFSVDKISYFLCVDEVPEDNGFVYKDARAFRELKPSWLAFAGATAGHLYRWYENHSYCGKCGGKMVHSETERAMCCPECTIIEYPKISPAVIVAVTDENRILLTKYSGRAYSRYALIAGFMEIGETFEDTVRREVMEEVGLKVKNIKYYKSQPWAFSESVLAGFYCELDGSPEIKLDERELSEAVWFDRADIPKDDTSLSLTWEMIETFRVKD